MPDARSTWFDLQTLSVNHSRFAPSGSRLVCTNPKCGSRMELEVASPYDWMDYRCACGHAFRQMGD